MADDDSGSELDFRINEDYAKNYNNWRKKEELQKLKDRFGSGSSSESSSSEDESEAEVAPKLDKEFFRTLSYLKAKNPKIYDKNALFFTETDVPQNSKSKKKNKEKPMYLKDYERHIILDKEGKLSDEEDNERSLKSLKKPLSYVEEQKEIKESFKKTLESDSDNDDDDNLLVKREKTAEEQVKEEEDYIEWLKGQKKDIDDEKAKKEMESLRAFWNNPDIDPDEAYLKDFILNKRYLEEDDKNRIPTYDEVVHDSEDLSEDEKTLEKQSLFEHKYNFRYEEPDPEFIKHYPRTLQDSLRRKDEKRKKKREELRERKQREKEQKQEELKRLKAMKRNEIFEKLEKLKEITGNLEIGFNDEDLEKDFDPQEHDRKMQEIFNNDYYETNEDSERPQFSYDEELDGEDWDNWHGNSESLNEKEEPHCEDPDFNMDADYDPHRDFQQSILEMSKRKKKRKSKFAEIISKKKPIFTPDEKTFEEYIDEYYKLDYEDLIGDMPCRFKYRRVKQNDFGLSINEILAARDEELNQWASLKKTCQYRSEEEEKYDFQAFQKKSQNLNRKQKVLSSVYEVKEEEEEKEGVQPPKKKKRKSVANETLDEAQTGGPSKNNEEEKEESVEPPKKKKKKWIANDTVDEEQTGGSSKNNVIESPSKTDSMLAEETKISDSVLTVESPHKKKRRKKKKKKNSNQSEVNYENNKTEKGTVTNNAKKFNSKTSQPNNNTFTDERLKAYGINPKKFKKRFKN